MSPGQIVLVLGSFVIWGLFVGIFPVWLYAAIRPRYGAGLKTALGAGFVPNDHAVARVKKVLNSE